MPIWLHQFVNPLTLFFLDDDLAVNCEDTLQEVEYSRGSKEKEKR